MLTSVEAYNDRGELLSLPLDDISTGYLVKEITGLDPVKATIVSTSFGRREGKQFQSSRREARDMTITLGLEPDNAGTSVRGLRNHLYSFFMPRADVYLRFYIDEVYFAWVEAKVEDLESPMFTQDPEVKISLQIFDPDFISPYVTEITGVSTSGTIETEIEYPGTIAAPFIFQLDLDRSLSEFTLNLRSPRNEFFDFNLATVMNGGDIYRISTVPGNKFARRNRGGVESSVLFAVNPASTWLQLYPGTNFFRVAASGNPIDWAMQFTPRYGAL